MDLLLQGSMPEERQLSKDNMKKYFGALLDNRSAKEKEKDYSIIELGASQSPTDDVYVTKAQALKQIRAIRDQGSTSSCGAHAGELIASHLWGSEDKKFSRAKIYRNRKNYPGEGMYITDIGDIMSKIGLEEYKAIKTTEEAYNATSPDIDPIFNTGAYTVDQTPLFEELVYTSNVLKLPQKVLFYSKNSKEYGKEIPVADPNFNDPVAAGIRHFVTIPPNGAFIYKKKKYLIIQDSSKFGGIYVRFFSEDWVDKRLLASSAYVLLEKNESTAIIKELPFTEDFKVGDTHFEIVRLQDVLKKLGYFPSNIPSTGYYRGITRQAVKDFQKKYEKSILWPLGLKLPTGYFGPSTRKILNKVIANQ